MADLGKVIKGLELCLGSIDSAGCPEGCPYYEACQKYENYAVFQPVMRDALTLLKAQQIRIAELEAAQEPRVMTLVEAFDAEVAWLERYADPKDGVEPIIQPIIVKYYENGYWQCLIEQDESPDLTLFIEDFKTEFRFWTSRPTAKQREAVKRE